MTRNYFGGHLECENVLDEYHSVCFVLPKNYLDIVLFQYLALGKTITITSFQIKK